MEPHPTDFYRRDSESTKSTSTEALQAEIERLKPLAQLGRMAATVAHEVRNPLAGISANAELLREVLSDPEDVESVDIILSEVERLSDLVSDLLHYTREREANCAPIDLQVLARSVCELSGKDADQAGVQLRYEGAGLAHGDIDLSRQALLNVVRNAIQACKAGGHVTVTVSEACIRVHDQGGGVPDEIKERMFEPFVTGKTRGLGLGAAVARRCLSRQGGDVVLAESTDQGSIFEFQWQIVP